MFNRDEQRSRAPALPIVAGPSGARRAIMPIDAPTGGTWIGANDAGIVAAILNANRSDTRASAKPATPARSRGLVVPHALAQSTLMEAARSLQQLDTNTMPSFRLFITDAHCYIIATWDSASLKVIAPRPLFAPIMLTSSSLGDSVVQPARTKAFTDCLVAGPSAEQAQSRFHKWRCPQAPELGVLMSRADARTISQCVVDVHSTYIEMHCLNLDDQLQPVSPSHPHRLALIGSEVPA